MNNFNDIVKAQRDFFQSGITKDKDFRLENLEKLRDIIKINENKIMEALKMDLNKSNFESYTTEIGFILDELSYIIKKLPSWMKPKREKTPIIHFPSSSYTYYEPLGTTLIISPWNYPFQLAIGPLIGAISAGNTATLKPSSKSKNTSRILRDIINQNFEPEFIYVIDTEEVSNEELLEEKFDHIFFTGSTKVGKKIMEKASKNLTKVTLELGGKSPAIVDESSNVEIAATRIAWGKLINAGQTCVAPDFIVVHENVKLEFLNKLKSSIINFYTKNPIENKEYPKIINKDQFDKLVDLIKDQDVYYGGKHSEDVLKIEPTIVDNVNWDNKLMESEIFGPIFPILPYNNLDELIVKLKEMNKPLAFYYFSENQYNIDKILKKVSFGGGCINDTIVHLATPYLEFGGVGESGIGGYHGKYSFLNFSNRKSILKKSTKIDIDIRYPPFKNKLNLIKKLMK